MYECVSAESFEKRDRKGLRQSVASRESEKTIENLEFERESTENVANHYFNLFFVTVALKFFFFNKLYLTT